MGALEAMIEINGANQRHGPKAAGIQATPTLLVDRLLR